MSVRVGALRQALQHPGREGPRTLEGLGARWCTARTPLPLAECAGCSPATMMFIAHPCALPSTTGTSYPPSISMRALSTPQHSSADRRFSTLCTLGHTTHSTSGPCNGPLLMWQNFCVQS